MTITARIHGSPVQTHLGALGPSSTLTVEDRTYDIPERGHYGEDRKPSRLAPHRIAATLEGAGYRPSYTDLVGPGRDGVWEIQVVKA